MAVFMLSLASSATGVVESICGFGWVGCGEISLWNTGCVAGLLVGGKWVLSFRIAPGRFGRNSVICPLARR